MKFLIKLECLIWTNIQMPIFKKNKFKIFFSKPIKKNKFISCNAKILKIDK